MRNINSTSKKKPKKNDGLKTKPLSNYNMRKWSTFDEEVEQLKAKYVEDEAAPAIKKAIREAIGIA